MKECSDPVIVNWVWVIFILDTILSLIYSVIVNWVWVIFILDTILSGRKACGR